MKHRIKKTGEIVTVISFSCNTNRSNLDRVGFIDSEGQERLENYNYYWDLEEVDETKDKTKDEPKEIDWEKRRYEIAKDVLVGFTQNNHPRMVAADLATCVKWAVSFADELIKQLKSK